MKVENYTVKWSYFTDFIVQHVEGKPIQRERDITECQILKNDVKDGENPIIAQESIVRLWTDTYCKETARKVSMNKALIFSKLEKDERSKFWEVYRTQTKEPRWSYK